MSPYWPSSPTQTVRFPSCVRFPPSAKAFFFSPTPMTFHSQDSFPGDAPLDRETAARPERRFPPRRDFSFRNALCQSPPPPPPGGGNIFLSAVWSSFGRTWLPLKIRALGANPLSGTVFFTNMVRTNLFLFFEPWLRFFFFPPPWR